MRRPGSGDANASAHSSALSQMSDHAVSTSIPSVGGLVQPDGRLDRPHHLGRGLEAGHLRVGLRIRHPAFADEVTHRAGLDPVLAEAGEHVGHVRQVCSVRTDEQHAPPVAEPRVGVQEVGGAVQGDDRLARPRTSVDDERTPGAGTDDGVLVGLDGAEHVAHPAERLPPRLAMNADWSSSAAWPSSPSVVKTSSQ